MNRTKIDWCDYTWNPVTGCRRGCSYCYARKIHNRFNHQFPFDDVVFNPDRLRQPLKVKKPSKIFVGSMSDIQFWKPNWIETILDICFKKMHTYMFLSKSPSSYIGYDWPSNTMQGLTVEIPSNGVMVNYIKKISKFPRPFISFEPLCGGLYQELPRSIELVIVGAMTGSNPIVPERDWIQSIKDHVPKEKIHWKDNIKKYL